ncbi:nuclease [Desulfosarcina ovata subsp. sediminis]|uniref:Nuclease n=1 Tax=Desulfosarcina ovata subsp. sediminis TaxID=885957 RepID=A0A5K7ZWB8_9BACT|nr:NERD domain-containing protein [Desulfosarcina ovata]BBO84549.1 nuclease [Desulfosarcina ovata subsp. sediminis]
MQMIPAVPYSTPSNAERKVFAKLETALPQSGFTAYHSLNLPHHPYKRFGEIDFLLCGPDGIFVLEVKGGRVNCDEKRQWHFVNRYGEETVKPESPFAQAESALHGFHTILQRHFGIDPINRFVIGYGVVLPDCDLRAGAEWERQTYANTADMLHFERWLAALIRYWRNKQVRTRAATPPDTATLTAVKAFIRPRFEAVVSLHIQASRAEARICSLTESQLKLIDMVSDNRRILCAGGAGTGKTFLAMELARRWTAGGDPVLLACHSAWLRGYLETRFDIPHLTVSTTASLAVAAKRAGVDRYAALIADEGQDLLNWKDLKALAPFVEGGLEDGRWCMFYDINNQSNLFGGIDAEALDWLEQSGATKFNLTQNVRNTKPILDTIKIRLGADMGIDGVGAGPKVCEYHARSGEDAAQRLADEIDRVIIKGGLSADRITILSPRPWARSIAAGLPENVIRSIAILDAYAVRQFPPARLSFGEIAAFKGMENEAIIVVDLPEPRPGATDQVLHYVGMSRARAILSVIYCDF